MAPPNRQLKTDLSIRPTLHPFRPGERNQDSRNFRTTWLARPTPQAPAQLACVGNNAAPRPLPEGRRVAGLKILRPKMYFWQTLTPKNIQFHLVSIPLPQYFAEMKNSKNEQYFSGALPIKYISATLLFLRYWIFSIAHFCCDWFARSSKSAYS